MPLKIKSERCDNCRKKIFYSMTDGQVLPHQCYISKQPNLATCVGCGAIRKLVSLDATVTPHEPPSSSTRPELCHNGSIAAEIVPVLRLLAELE